MGRQHLGGSVVGEIGPFPDRNAGVGLGGDRHAACCRPDVGDRRLGVGQVGAAVGTSSVDAQFGKALTGLGAGEAHHRSTGRVKAQGRHDRQVGGMPGAAECRLDGWQVAEGLDPDQVGPASLEGLCLFGEGSLGVGLGKRPERLYQLAGRAHGSGYQYRSVSLVGGDPGTLDPGVVDLCDASLQVMELEPVTVSTECVREDNVGAGVHIGAVDAADTVGVLEVPQLGCVSGGKAGIEQLCSHGAIEDQVAPGMQQVAEGAHGVNLPVGMRDARSRCRVRSGIGPR